MQALSRRLARVAPSLVLLALCAAEGDAVRNSTHGSFTYSLDDPYIHLALAENIARGTYGVNLGEVSAPASSLLWPFLLAPFATAAWAAYAPLIINLCASALTIALAHAFLRTLFVPRSVRAEWSTALVSVMFLLSSNMVGLAFTGMEHSLQVLGVVALLYAARLEQQDGQVRGWALATLALLPTVRYECLVLTLPLLVYFARRGHLRSACMAGGGSVLLLGTFSAWLVAHGLGFLPTSVEAKSDLSAGLLERASDIVRRSWEDPHVALFFGLVLGFLLLATLLQRAALRELALVLALATAGHLYIGNFGWFDRYEIYLFSADMLGLTWLLTEPVRALGRARAARVCALCLTALSLVSGSYLARPLQTPAAARNMFEQQMQMHRFAAHFYRKPVAVNDLGLVAFQNDSYVLDLSGLASREALLASRREEPRVWKERLLRERGVGLAMIYDPGRDNVPTSWIALGTLSLAGPLVTAAFAEVEFFATSASAASELRPLLARFRAELPQGVTFVPPRAPDCIAM